MILIEKHCELSPALPYRCVTAPRAHPEWVGQVRLGRDWPRSTAAEYQMLMFGEYVRYLRETCSSRRRVAQRCDVGITTVRDWEIRGKLPGAQYLPALADALTAGSAKQTLGTLIELRDAELGGRKVEREYVRKHVWRRTNDE